jgi:hypothetical protein
MSYSDGALHLWHQYMFMIQLYVSRAPITVGVGNCEYDHTEGGECKDPSEVVSGGGLQPYWGDFNDASASGGECSVLFSKRFAAPEMGMRCFGEFIIRLIVILLIWM